MRSRSRSSPWADATAMASSSRSRASSNRPDSRSASARSGTRATRRRSFAASSAAARSSRSAAAGMSPLREGSTPGRGEALLGSQRELAPALVEGPQLGQAPDRLRSRVVADELFVLSRALAPRFTIAPWLRIAHAYGSARALRSMPAEGRRARRRGCAAPRKASRLPRDLGDLVDGAGGVRSPATGAGRPTSGPYGTSGRACSSTAPRRNYDVRPPGGALDRPARCLGARAGPACAPRAARWHAWADLDSLASEVVVLGPNGHRRRR